MKILNSFLNNIYEAGGYGKIYKNRRLFGKQLLVFFLNSERVYTAFVDNKDFIVVSSLVMDDTKLECSVVEFAIYAMQASDEKKIDKIEEFFSDFQGLMNYDQCIEIFGYSSPNIIIDCIAKELGYKYSAL